MQDRRVFLWGALALLGGCATGGMISSDGKGNTTRYSRFYDLGFWLDEGKLGLQIVVDHGRPISAWGVMATGTVTLYAVNLQATTVQLDGLAVSTTSRNTLTPSVERSLPADVSTVLASRSRTKIPLGSIEIFDYGTQISLSLTVRVGGSTPKSLKLSVPRVTEPQLAAWGTGGRPPYPWFQTPYYPFVPPLSIVD